MESMNSILTSIKKLLGPDSEDTHFDPDITIHINSVFSILTQLGVGPVNGFMISSSETVWKDYLQDNIHIEMVKTFMYMKVKLIFDPPTSSAAIEALKFLIAEAEWRIAAAAESGTFTNTEITPSVDYTI